jgi:hypothetical protein
VKKLFKISAVQVRLRNTLDEENKIKVIQNCAGKVYAQVIIIADGTAQIKNSGAQNATAKELCKSMKK